MSQNFVENVTNVN